MLKATAMTTKTYDIATFGEAMMLLIADRAGTLVQVGSPQTLYHHPRDADTARFLGDCIVLDDTPSVSTPPRVTSAVR